jgi:hypothetical protein
MQTVLAALRGDACRGLALRAWTVPVDHPRSSALVHLLA